MKSRLEPCMDGGDLVDLVGIEPTTSSMPWTRAPSCATGPRLQTKSRSPAVRDRGSTAITFAHITGIVNEQRFFSRVEIYHNRRREND